MRYMTWSGGWGNLRYANNAALVALAWALQQPLGTVSGEVGVGSAGVEARACCWASFPGLL